MQRCLHCTLTVFLCSLVGLGAVHARVRAQTAAVLYSPPPTSTAPVNKSEPVPVLRVQLVSEPMRADNTPAPPLVYSGTPTSPALRAEGIDNALTNPDVARLRSLATTNVARSQRGASAASATKAQANAAWVLGLLYLHGIAVATNPVEATKWFESARNLGEPLAVAGLAWCDIEGCKTQPNPALARRWLPALRAVNLPRAQYLQWLIDTRLSPLQVAVPSVQSYASSRPDTGLPNRQLLLMAAQGGDVQAAIELGLESVAANRLEQALTYFRAVAPRSQVATANVALLEGRLQAPSKTSQPTTSADETLALARRNHRGEGQPANYVEAIRLYQMAQNLGSVQARKMLELIFSRPLANGHVDIAWMQQLAYANYANDMVVLGSAIPPPTLQREPTPLFDLLPPFWRSYPGIKPRQP
jgi:uncharacterized protein